MGTVPTPIRPGAATPATSAQAQSWADALVLLLKPPSCRVSLSTDVSATVAIQATWDAEQWDIVQTGDTEMHSTSTNPARITIRTAGRYRVHGMACLSTGAAASVQVGVLKNGSYVAPVTLTMATGQTYEVTYSDEIQCAVGDYLNLYLTTSAGTLTLLGTKQCFMVATWVSN